MTHHLCIPSDVFEAIVQAYPAAVVEADGSRKFTRIDGVEYSAPLADLDGAA